MLSSVLNSDRAVEVNISIMRTFVQLREMLSTHADLARKLEELEQKYDKQFKVVFDAIRKHMKQPEKSKRKIGFGEVEETSGPYESFCRYHGKSVALASSTGRFSCRE